MKRLSSPFDRFPGELFAIVVGVALVAVFIAGPWAALAVVSIAAVAQAFLVRRAYSARDSAVATERQTAARDQVLREELEKIRTRLPYEDPETGLGTRRQLEVSWTRQLARQRRWGEPFALAIVEVTDAFGKDQLLSPAVGASVAKDLLDVARTEDVVCRLDNHTFAVLLAAATLEGARAFVDRLRVKISAQPHAVEGAEMYLSAVGGVAVWDDHINSAVDMLKVADLDLARFRRDHSREVSDFAGVTRKAS